MDETRHLCGLYVRVSTPRQASVEEGSLDTQISQLQAYVDFENRARKGEWLVEEVYREEGRSGKDLNRPQFERMMVDVDAGRIDTVLIWKIDRLTRSLTDFFKVWEHFELRGVNLVSLNEKFDTHTAFGRAALKLLLIFAELEREQTSERTSATLAYRATQGMWNGGRVIGYDPDPESKGELRINSEGAELVRLAFDKCVELGSAGATTRFLNEHGYRMPSYESRRGKKQGGGLFTKQATVRLLTSPVYVGRLKWKGETFKGQQEPIIAVDLFERVQELLNVNRRHPKSRRKAHRHVFILQGLVRCGKCGSVMTPAWGTNGSGNPYHYYQCTRKQHVGKQACESKSVPAAALERMVVEHLKELSSDEGAVTEIANAGNARQSEMLRKLGRDKKQVTRQNQTVMEKLDALVGAVETGGAEAFKRISERMKELEIERRSMQEQLQQIDFEVARVEEETLSADAMVQTFKQFGQAIESTTPEELKMLVPTVVDVVEWHEDPSNPGSGHIRIGYFEQTRLGLRKDTSADRGGVICSVKGTDWLRRQGSNL